MKHEFWTTIESLSKSPEHRTVTYSAGAIGAVITFAFGGWTEALILLFVLMAADYVSGIAASIKEGKGLNSAVGFWGLGKKGFVLLMILIAHRVDLLLQTDVVMNGATYFYIANEFLSIIENYGRIGLPVPQRLRNIVSVLRDRGNSA